MFLIGTREEADFENPANIIAKVRYAVDFMRIKHCSNESAIVTR